MLSAPAHSAHPIPLYYRGPWAEGGGLLREPGEQGQSGQELGPPTNSGLLFSVGFDMIFLCVPAFSLSGTW